jgi:hypothetical protein
MSLADKIPWPDIAAEMILSGGPYDTSEYPALMRVLADEDDIKTIDRAERGAARIYGYSSACGELQRARDEFVDFVTMVFKLGQRMKK